MLQRVQSILLFFSALCMIAVLFFPTWEKKDVEKSEKISLTPIHLIHEKADIETNEIQIISEQTTIYIGLLGILAAAVSFYSIFRYDNRLLQMKFGALNSLLIGAAIGVSVYFILQAEKVIAPDIRGEYVFGFYLYVAALLCNTFANRFIRRDEKLVRSADRIR